MPKGILDGIRVLDLTVYQLGPVNTMMLALMGADVIKIEPPTGEPGRINVRGRMVHGGQGKGFGGIDLSAYFEANNHCKRSIVLDLTKPRAMEILYQLVAKSDVFAQNIRPGSAEKLGAGYETLKKYNPKLIYYTGTSFGTKGPDGRKPGMDASGIARSGWSYLAPTGNDPPVPIWSLSGSSDQMGAIIGAFTIVSALLARERYGIGQYVETSHLTASMWLLQCRGQTSYYMKGSMFNEMRGASRETTANTIFNHYKCKDGEWISLVNPVQRHWAPVCAALGIPDSLRDDPRFVDPRARRDNARAAVKLLDDYFARWTRGEFIKRCEGKDINWEKVQKWDDLPTDPQVIANEYTSKYTHDLTGETYDVVNLPAKFTETPAMRLGRAPLLGEHTAEILTDLLGYKKEDVPRLIEEIGKPVPTFGEA
jgi:crotonobetainyl-CoA:carnitine CoA-transferase CaiB-like acyl-CoA transferase